MTILARSRILEGDKVILRARVSVFLTLPGLTGGHLWV
jgi:hypothetical protein